MKTIFISCASYRDVLCNTTIDSIYKNAKNPQNIFMGIVEQNDLSSINETCIPLTLPKEYMQNIKTLKMPYKDAKGPTYARYLATQLYDGQDFFFQIDSHSLFVKDWDEKILKMFHDLQQIIKSDKIILSHYPASYTEYGKDDPKLVPTICSGFFNERGMISFLGAEHVDMSKRDFLETPYIAAGMFFSKGDVLNDVPFDPHLDYLFVGEEISHSIRCWTSGYRIFNPMENLIYHMYTRAEAPKIWTDKKYSDENAFNKVKMIIGIDDENWNSLPNKYNRNLNLYGLGKEKTLQEYYDFAGIHLKEKQVVKNFCNGEIKTLENQNTKSLSKIIFWVIILLWLFILVAPSGFCPFRSKTYYPKINASNNLFIPLKS